MFQTVGTQNHVGPFIAILWQVTLPDEHMFFDSEGKGKMPAFGKKLSENEIAALVTYVRMLKR